MENTIQSVLPFLFLVLVSDLNLCISHIMISQVPLEFFPLSEAPPVFERDFMDNDPVKLPPLRESGREYEGRTTLAGAGREKKTAETIRRTLRQRIHVSRFLGSRDLTILE